MCDFSAGLFYYPLLGKFSTEAQKTHNVAITGPARLCPPSTIRWFYSHYARLSSQWPTIVTLIMFPILVAMYVKLARREEREVLAEFGDQYRLYMSTTRGFRRV